MRHEIFVPVVARGLDSGQSGSFHGRLIFADSVATPGPARFPSDWVSPLSCPAPLLRPLRVPSLVFLTLVSVYINSMTASGFSTNALNLSVPDVL